MIPLVLPPEVMVIGRAFFDTRGWMYILKSVMYFSCFHGFLWYEGLRGFENFSALSNVLCYFVDYVTYKTVSKPRTTVAGTNQTKYFLPNCITQTWLESIWERTRTKITQEKTTFELLNIKRSINMCYSVRQ